MWLTKSRCFFYIDERLIFNLWKVEERLMKDWFLKTVLIFSEKIVKIHETFSSTAVRRSTLKGSSEISHSASKSEKFRGYFGGCARRRRLGQRRCQGGIVRRYSLKCRQNDIRRSLISSRECPQPGGSVEEFTCFVLCQGLTYLLRLLRTHLPRWGKTPPPRPRATCGCISITSLGARIWWWHGHFLLGLFISDTADLGNSEAESSQVGGSNGQKFQNLTIFCYLSELAKFWECGANLRCIIF